MKNATVIALVGKGGVGKTSISALTVRLHHDEPLRGEYGTAENQREGEILLRIYGGSHEGRR